MKISLLLAFVLVFLTGGTKPKSEIEAKIIKKTVVNDSASYWKHNAQVEADIIAYRLSKK